MRIKALRFFTFVILLTAAFAFQTEGQQQKAQKVNKKAEKLAKQGDEFYLKGDYLTAAGKYSEAVKISPNYPYAQFWKGQSYYRLEQMDEAIEALSKALDHGFSPLEVYKVRWMAQIRKGDYEAALRDAEEGARLDPNNPNFQKGLAESYFAKKDFRNALESYKKVAAAEPTNGDVMYYIAASQNNLGNLDEQYIAALQATKNGTKFLGESWFYVGDALQKSNKLDEAITAYENSIAANAKSFDSYNNMSELFRIKGDYARAIQIMEKAKAQLPNESSIFANLSWYYSLSGQHPQAIAAAQTAIELNPQNFTALKNLCRAYNDVDLPQQAISTCKKALELNNGDGESNFYLGRAYSRTGQTDVANQHFNKAVEGLEKDVADKTEYPDNFYILGNAYYATKQYDKSIEAYKKALKLNPNFGRARYNLALVYFITEKPQLVQEQLEALKVIDAKLAQKLSEAITKK